jgi:hypothetical protein
MKKMPFAVALANIHRRVPLSERSGPTSHKILRSATRAEDVAAHPLELLPGLGCGLQHEPPGHSLLYQVNLRPISSPIPYDINLQEKACYTR